MKLMRVLPYSLYEQLMKFSRAQGDLLSFTAGVLQTTSDIVRK
jgi:hypothetical protein